MPANPTVAGAMGGDSGRVEFSLHIHAESESWAQRGMWTLQFYLIRQVLTTLVMTILVFTFVLLLGNVLKEIMVLLVNGQASLWIVFRAISLLIPFVLAFSLPIGMLTAALLVFGRLSADQELTAIRASGVSLVALVSPVVVLSTLLCGLAAWINLSVAPSARTAYKRLLTQLALDKTANLIIPGTFMTEIPGHWIYVGEKHGDELRDIQIYVLDPKGRPQEFATGTRGRLYIDKVNRQMQISLTNVGLFFRYANEDAQTNATAPPRTPGLASFDWEYLHTGEFHTDPIKILDRSSQERKPKISEMTYTELRNELAKREALEKDLISIGVKKPGASKTPPLAPAPETRVRDIITPVRVQLNRQVAFSFAPLSFTLIGIPLGIRAHRRETSIGVAISLMLIAAYHAFLIIGQSLDQDPRWHPWLFMWLPNFLFQGLGACLLWRANRGL